MDKCNLKPVVRVVLKERVNKQINIDCESMRQRHHPKWCGRQGACPPRAYSREDRKGVKPEAMGE